jgi:hypothetical protein
MSRKLTIKEGCFNCSKISKCIYIRCDKSTLTDILKHSNGQRYRYGCCCGHYEPKEQKEKVVFT